MISCTYTACDHEKISVTKPGHPHCIWDTCKNGYTHCGFDHRQFDPQHPPPDLYAILADYSTPAELVKLGCDYNLFQSRKMPTPAFQRGKFKLYHTATVLKMLNDRTDKHWTRNERLLLLEMKDAGNNWTLITHKLGRSYWSCRAKYKELTGEA